MGKDLTYISYAETRSEREGERIPGKTGSTVATSFCSLLNSSTKE